MIKKIILICLLLSLFMMGCQKATETTPESNINVDSEISEIDSIDQDLNLEELDTIESDLEEINW